MNTQTSLTLTTSPQDSLHALERAVSGRFNWRILVGGKTDAPKFVIEKQVRYGFLRGLPLTAKHKITGSFQPNGNGATQLEYVVSGDGGPAIMNAVVWVITLLVVTVSLAMIVFNPRMVNQWIGILLMMVMVVTIGAYVVFAYRNYQGHLRELSAFMEAFSQQLSQWSIVSHNAEKD
jgi:hypothetical protein